MIDRYSITVITPCFNGGAYLRETIESVLAQTHQVLEMIVVDDGSTDDSAAIAESFGSPVRVIRQANQGESVARNVGIKAAQGDYLQFLDADDLLSPDAIERKVQAVAEKPGAVAISRVAFFTTDPQAPTQVSPAPTDEWFPRIITTNFGAPHSWLVPRQAVLKVGGFDASLRWFEDWEMWTRIAFTQPVLVPVDHAGALYRQHAQSQLATTKDADRARGHAAVMSRLCTGLLEHPEILAKHSEPMLWALWTSLRRAREKGVAWQELMPVTESLTQLTSNRTADLSKSRLATMIRYAGPRWTSRLCNLTDRESTWSQKVTSA